MWKFINIVITLAIIWINIEFASSYLSQGLAEDNSSYALNTGDRMCTIHLQWSDNPDKTLETREKVLRDNNNLALFTIINTDFN